MFSPIKIPYCRKPEFLSQGIPCAGLNAFILKDNGEKDMKEKTQKVIPIQSDELKTLSVPKFFKNRSNIFRQPCFDEKYAHQVV